MIIASVPDTSAPATSNGLMRKRMIVRTTMALVVCGVVFAALPAAAAPAWDVPEAEVRFTVKLTGGPTHGSAGYFAHLPDGGILPGPNAITTVVPLNAKRRKGDKAGLKILESYTLWHSRTGGLSVVFADPGQATKAVHIYVSGSSKPRLWTPSTGLTPSAILCVEPGKADLGTARRLAKMGPVGPTVHARNKAGIGKAPFSIGGDETGRPRPASFYFLTHVNVTDPGETWIAPFTLDGETAVLVNGKKLIPRKRIDKWGGTGQYFTLQKGLHRIEVLQTAPGTGAYKGAHMYLTWRTKNASMKELGGVRSNKVPMSGTSRMETRVLNSREVVRSGNCSVEGAVTRTGGPVAVALARATHTFWFGNEAPLIVYELRALTAGHPAGSTYQWDLPGGGKVTGPTVRWVFPGFRENKALLTAKSSAGTTQCAESFFGFSTAHTSLENAAHRKAFRDALTTMLNSYPTDPDPAASWGSAFWNNLIRTTEQGQGFELLQNLFTTRWDTTREKLSPVQIVALQDIFLDDYQRRNPKAAIELIDELHKSFDRGIRRDSLLLRKAEIYMFYLDDREAAARGLASFTQKEGDLAEGARIRLGDLAFINGDLNKATEFYANVQAKARRHRNQLDRLVTQDLLGKGAGATENTKEKPRRMGNPRPVGTSAEKVQLPPNPASEVLPFQGANWKAGALRDVSNSENVETLIEGGFLLEAGQALRSWEREFPLSKISGDLLLVEANYRMKLNDWKRAHVMLEAYCREVDASSFLPDAARMLIKCASQMKTPRHEIRDVIERVKKRLEYHPVAKELEEFLSSKK